MSCIVSRLTEGGRIIIPAKYRRKLGLQIGDAVTLRLVDNELRIISRSEAVKRAQALVRKRIPRSRSLVAELHKERSREAANE